MLAPTAADQKTLCCRKQGIDLRQHEVFWSAAVNRFLVYGRPPGSAQFGRARRPQKRITRQSRAAGLVLPHAGADPCSEPTREPRASARSRPALPSLVKAIPEHRRRPAEVPPKGCK